MNPALNNISENDLFDVIFQRLDEIRRVWKTLKGSLIESFSSLDQFGKSLSKNSRTLLNTCHTSDPSFYSTLTVRMLTVEDKTSQRFNQVYQGISSQLSKSFDDYGEKLDSTQASLVDSANTVLKQLANARQNYTKEKAKYERTCKETEALVLEKKKLTSDPLSYYNLVTQKRVRVKLFQKLKELKEAENMVKEAVDATNEKQLTLNSALGDILTTFRVALKTTFKNSFEAVKRHNKGLKDLIEKNLEDSTAALASAPKQDLNEVEEKYIEEQAKLKTSSEGGNDMMSDETFPDIQKKLMTDPRELQDLQVLLYVDEIQKHYDTYMMIIEERRKVVKGLKTYLQELATLWENVSKLLQKTSKNPFASISGSFAFSKRTTILLDPFYNALAGLVKKFQNFATFITMKLAVMDTVINDQRTNMKNYQANMQKAIKDHMNSRAALETNSQLQEKTQKKMAEIPDKDDPRIPRLKKELEAIISQHVECKAEIRRHAVETARVITKIEQEYRKQENSKSQSFRHIVEGILGQENCLYMEILGIIKTANDAVGPDEGVDPEVMVVLGQDEKLAECLRYVDGTKDQKTAALSFQKLYVPPAELSLEYEKGQLGNLAWITPQEYIDLEENLDKKDEDDDELDKENQEEGEIKKEEEGKEMEESGSSSPAKLKKKFQINTNEKLLGDFSCAILQTIPRQGWMYIYNTKVCFSSAKIFGDFVVKIPMKDIQKADKKVISLVFDNALTLTTKYGDIVFTSFFSRDKALNLIEECLKGDFDNIEEFSMKSPANAFKMGNEDMNFLGVEEQKLQKKVSRPGLPEIKLNVTPHHGKKPSFTEDPVKSAPLEKGEKKEDKLRVDLLSAQIKGESTPINNQGESRGRKEEAKFDKKDHERALSRGPKPHIEGMSADVAAVSTPASTTLKKEISVESKGEEKGMTTSLKFEKESSKKEQTPALKLEKESSKQEQIPSVKLEKESSKKEQASAGNAHEEVSEEKEKQQINQELLNRKTNIRKGMVPAEGFPQLILQEIFNCSAVEAFNVLFADGIVEHKGRRAETFMLIPKMQCGDTDIKITKWNPIPPKAITENDLSFEGQRDFVKSVEKSSRVFNFMHPVKEQGIMFLPKACPVEEKQTVHWLGMDEIIIQVEVRSSKVPLSDCFYVKNSFSLKNVDGVNKCEFMWKYGIEMVKSTIFKGKIMKSSLEETTEYANKTALPMIREKVREFVRDKEKAVQAKKTEEVKVSDSKDSSVKSEDQKVERQIVKEKEQPKEEEKAVYQAESITKQEVRQESLGEILKTYLEESKGVQEKMNSELKGIRLWLLMLAIMNSLILIVLIMKK